MNLRPGVSLGMTKPNAYGRVVGRRFQQRRRQHHDRVGDRQRRQHSAAAHDETRVGLLLDSRGEKRIGLPRGPDAAVGLRRDQRVRQAQVGLAQLLVEPHGVRAEARVRRREERRAGGIGADRAVQVIRYAAHHAVRVLRPIAPSRG